MQEIRVTTNNLELTDNADYNDISMPADHMYAATPESLKRKLESEIDFNQRQTCTAIKTSSNDNYYP